MCGLIASITTDTYCTRLDDWWKDAFMASQVRGVHSSGMYQLDRQGKLTTFKRAVNASEFVTLPPAIALMRDSTRSPLTVGHVRHATQGSIKDENAHPFVVTRDDKSRVVGVHNGTLQGWRMKPGSEGQDVDSAWAFKIFAQEGPIDAFEYFNGAFAFIWHDSQHPDHVWVARNKERPLNFFVTDDNKTVMFASELGMLGWLAQRNRFKLGDDSKCQMFYLPEDKIFKFSLKEPGKFEQYEMPKYDPKTSKAPPVVSTGPNYQDYNRRYNMEDDIPFGVGSYGGTGNRHYGRTNYSTSYSVYATEARVLERVKLALKKARYKEEKKSEAANVATVIDSVALENNLSSAIQEHLRRKEVDVWALVGDKFYVRDVNTKNATFDEIKKAKDLGFFEVAVAYSGVVYDDETGETLGDAHIKLRQQVESYDCILRGLTKSYAELKYCNSNNLEPMVIIGAREGEQPGQLMFIVSELTSNQKDDLMRRIKGVQNAMQVH